MPQNACRHTQRISKTTFLALFNPKDAARLLLDSIPLAHWSVASFNRRTRDACVRIDNGKRSVIVNVSLPHVIVK